MSDDLIAQLRHHETEYQELAHGPLCGRALAEIERLRNISRQILHWSDFADRGLPHHLDRDLRIALGVTD